MRFGKLAMVIGVALAILLLAAGCARATPTPAPTPKATATPIPKPHPEGVLKIGLSSLGSEAHDPYSAIINAKNQQSLVFDFLVGANRERTDISPATGLANKWEQSSDGLSWTFYLRKGVQFDKGWGEATADDVKFSLERIASPGNKSAYIAGIMKPIEKIEVVDPYTVRFVLKSPSITLPYDLSPLLGTEGIVMPKKYITSVGEREFANNPVGSGPYRLAGHEPGLYFKYEAREDYWQWVPRFKEVYIYNIPEEATRIAMLKRGELDVAQVSMSRLKELESAGLKTFEKIGSQNPVVFMENQWEGYFADKRVRLALNLAVNKKEMSQSLFDGRARILSTAPNTWSLGSKNYEPYGYDTKKAKDLLAEAGYPKGFEVTVFSIPMEPMPLISQAIPGYLEVVGVKSKIVLIDVAGWADRLQKKNMPNYLTAHPYANRIFTASTYRANYHTTGSVSHVKDSKLDALIEAIEASKNQDELASRQAAAQQYIYDNAMEIFLFEMGEFAAVNPKAGIEKWSAGGKSIIEFGVNELVWPK